MGSISEEWCRVENTHEAIISEEVFQKVQELIASRRRKRRNGTTQIFAGLIKWIALGSDLPVVAETACELYKAGYGEKLMFCGGIGHSTVNLKKIGRASCRERV